MSRPTLQATRRTQAVALVPVAVSASPSFGAYSAGRSRYDSGIYRLMGDGRSNTYAVNVGTMDGDDFGLSFPVPVRPTLGDPYDAWELQLRSRQSQQEDRALRKGRASLPRGALAVVGIVLLILLAWALVTPAFAATSPISRYTEMASTTSIQPSAPPVIDASSVPQSPNASAPQSPSAAPAEAHSVIGVPSISVAQIESVLQKYGSPTIGLGQKLYDLGVQYGIDPAYALAFFVHESGCGTRGVARFTRSLGNIRWSPGWDNYEGYRQYPTWEAGMEDWYKLITDQYIGQWGLRTVDAIVPVYAPSGDGNSPSSYISSVESMVDSWRGK